MKSGRHAAPEDWRDELIARTGRSSAPGARLIPPTYA